MTIAEKIKESRLKLGLTQQEVSEKLFVTRQTISNWENNRSTPDIDTLIKLSDLYQIDLESLLKPEQLAEEPEIKSDEKNPTFRLPLYLLNFTAVAACVFTDFLTPTGTMTLWTAASHFLLLVNFVLLFGFFLTKKDPSLQKQLSLH
jgi:transcriptional regulator with XRE-family HTH domain